MPDRCQCEACQIAPHYSSCAVHNAPALANGPCDCAYRMWRRIAIVLISTASLSALALFGVRIWIDSL
jgi:hypothetical protein